MPFLSKSVNQWNRTLHVYLTMAALVMLLFYSMTGLMLNHPDWFGLDSPRTVEKKLTVPADLLKGRGQMWLFEYLRKSGEAKGEMSSFDDSDKDTLRVQFTMPGRKSDYVITVATGETTATHELRGITGVLGDLHTGKSVSFFWKRVIDATGLLLLIASLTGVLLWTTLPKRRKYGLLVLAVSLLMVGVVYWVMMVM